MLRTIISLDRDSDLLATRAETLQNAGYVVLSACDPEDALRLLANQQAFGLVILGQMFAEHVTEWLAMMLYRTSAIPVVLMHSGEANRSIRADAYVNVTDGPEALLAAVESIFSDNPRHGCAITAVKKLDAGRFSGACTRW